MSNNPALSKLVALDPLGGGAKVPVGFMHSIFQVKPEIESENFNVCPVLLVHPMEDRWTQVESSQVLFDKLKTEKTIVMLEGCGHFPVEEPGFSQLENAALRFLHQVSAQVKGRAQPVAADVK
jgi:alpha-beta hydrolase superfamily lysophospholipase